MYTVPASNLVAIVCILIFSFVLPIGLFIFWKIRTKANWSAFFIGCGTFVLFALILEQLLHTTVLTIAGDGLRNNLWLYALYGGLAAGLFEETGRFVAMKFWMKRTLSRENAVMYGIGHGGIECMLVVGMTYISNLVMALMINSGGLQALTGMMDEATAQTFQTAVEQLCTLPAWQFYMAGVERISAVLLHIGMSYLVYRAVRESRIRYYAAAVGVHFAVDAGTVVLTQYVSAIGVEIVLLAVVIVFIAWVMRQYRNEPDRNDTTGILRAGGTNDDEL